MKVIQVKSLEKKFKTIEAVKINFSINQNQTLALLGPNMWEDNHDWYVAWFNYSNLDNFY